MRAVREFRGVLVDAATRQLKQQRDQGNTERDVLDAKVNDLETKERNLRRSISISEALSDDELTSFEMAEVVRGFVPRCLIVPVQSHDTGQVYPRAKLLVRGNMQNYNELTEIVMDLFEPPVYIPIMKDVVQLRSQMPRRTYEQIGAQLGVNRMAVKRALNYARLMQELGVTEPFRELNEKPESASRWRDAS